MKIDKLRHDLESNLLGGDSYMIGMLTKLNFGRIVPFFITFFIRKKLLGVKTLGEDKVENIL